jgi:pimeloyl-ACP methyl ester carboxylesterase
MANNMKLNAERSKITANGQMVMINGRSMHVYVEGENKTVPLLVFLSGGGTAAPVYDFKPLYALLSNDFRIAVVERIGYGYSEIADVPRDINTILSETRAALSLVNEQGPYILIPHSMSGLEALQWARLYPNEVRGIVGIDMAIPLSLYRRRRKGSVFSACRLVRSC